MKWNDHLIAARTGFRVLPSNKEEPLARALAELGVMQLGDWMNGSVDLNGLIMVSNG